MLPSKGTGLVAQTGVPSAELNVSVAAVDFYDNLGLPLEAQVRSRMSSHERPI